MIHHQEFSPHIALEEHIRYFLLSKISLHTMEEAARWLQPDQRISASRPSRYGAVSRTMTG